MEHRSNNMLSDVGFHPVIAEWFKHQFGKPSPPQKFGWPSIAAGHHSLILAPTGSGKTLAAFLWSIDHLFRSLLPQKKRPLLKQIAGVHTLYISPLKALNNDIHQNLKSPLKEIERLALSSGIEAPPIRVAVRTGDTPSHVRQSMLRNPPHILITTPESLYLLLTSERGRELFRTLRYTIIDEIHAVCSNKRGVHLSLSLERLMPLCENEPVRIGLSATQKPLGRIAAYLGGQTFVDDNETASPRPVKIIDCGQRENLDLRVISPVASFQELPEASVWEPVYQKLYEWIRAHRTTLVFAGMRAQTEKIARQLNRLHRQVSGDPDAELALAHHGSISREARYDIEARLKAGKVPAVIATASLELGIDIGSIDLVVHLEAPKSVTAALQRVGRSGHLISATSKGRILVLYPADLDDAVAIAGCMHTGDIEETRIPENALDVLAQQVVAEVGIKSWSYDRLLRLVRCSYCFRRLPRSVFQNVVEMLSGRFSDNPLYELKPRLNWDKINNRLIALRGSRLMAVMNSGTIPDRGYYAVYLENSNVRLGEVEEEFVFESRVGEAFFLGNSEWLIRKISQDRIIVRPIAAIKPKAPFWKGDIRYRDFGTSRKIGEFRQAVLDRIDQGSARQWLRDDCHADAGTADNLIAYFKRQREYGQMIPTSAKLMAECTMDSGGQPLLILHAPFGARVNGAWAIALGAALEERYQIQIQYSFDDDGLIIRLLDTGEFPDFRPLFKLDGKEIEHMLIQALPHAPVFSVYFRYNAARALMLPRSQPRKRIPLWLQRLRAADLLQAVQQYSDFPVIIETLRECLQDVFDLPALKRVIKQLNEGSIQLEFIDTSIPSPMAAGILFKFVASHLYELDQNRQPGRALNVSSELLDDILDQEAIPVIVTRELVEEAERRWQHKAAGFQASNQEDVFAIIEKLGPLTVAELEERSGRNPVPWLQELEAAGRVRVLKIFYKGRDQETWSVADDPTAYPRPDDEDGVRRRIRRFLASRGPVTVPMLESDSGLPSASIQMALEDLYNRQLAIRGLLVAGWKEEQWCDRQNFRKLYRMAVARRRVVQEPADRFRFNRFLFEWHRISMPGQPLKDLIERYRGFRFPLNFFERNVLPTRFLQPSELAPGQMLAEFESLIAEGEVIVLSGRANEIGRRFVEFRLRGDGHLFADNEALGAISDCLDAASAKVYDFLRENGASYARDMEWGTGFTRLQLQEALQQLAEAGLVSCENYSAFNQIIQSPQKRPQRDVGTRGMPANGSPWRKGRHVRRGSRSEIRKMIQSRSRMRDGRWFLTTSLAVMGKPLDENRRAEMQARLLLQRYGILVKEWYRREKGLLSWYRLFQVLKRMEWQGEIRRGYFVNGLSGVQFAMPEALELLEKISRNRLPAENSVPAEDKPVWLSTADPALPHGPGYPWDLTTPGATRLNVVRSAMNYLAFVACQPVIYAEGFFERLTFLTELSDAHLEALISQICSFLKLPGHLKPRNRIEVLQIDGRPAAASRHAHAFTQNGFETEGDGLILWPSAL